MGAYFDGLEKTAFGGIPFPVEQIDIEGERRDHEHEFPHTPGAAPEKLGRKLYRISIVASFHDLPKMRELYGRLYPDSLEKLFALFEAEKTAALTVGNLGTIQAYCKNWKRTLTSSGPRSGERVTLMFREDQSSAFLVEALIRLGGASIESLNDKFNVLAGELPRKIGLFEKINDAITKVLAERDRADMVADMVESKLLAIAHLCDEADRTIKELQDPINHQILDALKALWASVVNLATDIAQKGTPIKTFVTPKRQTIADVSMAVYETTTRGMDILVLNDIDDPMSIPPNTRIKYYDDAA